MSYPITNLDLQLYEVPYEVIEAAQTITEWTIRHGMKDWMIMGVADRNLVEKQQTVIRTLLY